MTSLSKKDIFCCPYIHWSIVKSLVASPTSEGELPWPASLPEAWGKPCRGQNGMGRALLSPHYHLPLSAGGSAFNPCLLTWLQVSTQSSCIHIGFSHKKSYRHQQGSGNTKIPDSLMSEWLHRSQASTWSQVVAHATHISMAPRDSKAWRHHRGFD